MTTKIQIYLCAMIIFIAQLAHAARSGNQDLSGLSYEKIYRTYREKKAWGIEAQIDLSDCDQYIIRSEEQIRDYAKKLCSVLNIVRIREAQIYHVGTSDEKTSGYCMTQVTDAAQITARFVNSGNKVLIRILSNEPFDALKVIALSKIHFKAGNCDTKVVLQ